MVAGSIPSCCLTVLMVPLLLLLPVVGGAAAGAALHVVLGAGRAGAVPQLAAALQRSQQEVGEGWGRGARGCQVQASRVGVWARRGGLAGRQQQGQLGAAKELV